MIYINRFLDSEYNDSVKYEQFIITNANCKNLIDDLCLIWEELCCYDSIKELYQEYDLPLYVSNETIEILRKQSLFDKNCDDFENEIDFVETILRNENLLAKYKTLKFEY